MYIFSREELVAAFKAWEVAIRSYGPGYTREELAAMSAADTAELSTEALLHYLSVGE
jgi:hypothetical protein